MRIESIKYNTCLGIDGLESGKAKGFIWAVAVHLNPENLSTSNRSSRKTPELSHENSFKT